MNKRTCQQGIDLLKKLEGFSSAAYKDIGGVLTIGYGFSQGVKTGDKITIQEAEKRLKLELICYEKCINENVFRNLTDNQFSALVLFCYNIGKKAFIGSSLCDMLNKQKSAQECANQFLRWNKVKGVEVKGLTNRRRAERELFLRSN